MSVMMNLEQLTKRVNIFDNPTSIVNPVILLLVTINPYSNLGTTSTTHNYIDYKQYHFPITQYTNLKNKNDKQ